MTPTPIADLRTWLTRSFLPLGLIWLDVTFRPWVGFTRHVQPRDQSRGVIFAIAVVAAWVALSAAYGTFDYHVIGDLRLLSLVLWITLLLAVVTPVAIHLLGAVVTLMLVFLAPHRRGVSETVQVIAFAMAPIVFVAVPNTTVQAVSGLYASVVLIVGLTVVHRLPFERGVVIGALPAYVLFLYGFGAESAIVELLRSWYII